MQLSYYCFKDKKKRKMPLDTPLNTKNFKLKDKLGLNIKEQIEICNKYGITHKLYVKRKEKGWSLKEILETPKGDKRFKYIIIDDIRRNKQAVSLNSHSKFGRNVLHLGNMSKKANLHFKYSKLDHLALQNNLYQDKNGVIKAY
ncbi:hypothetical protein H8731_000451 [Campylobacter jejuni]|nr:hypothetical protein [Campylobacter jejuni]